MTQHTPGPLYIAYHDEEPSIHVCRKFDSTVTPMNSETFGSCYGAHIARISYTSTGCPTKEKAEANARRLVACWNACEGLDTEAIEIADTFATIMNDAGKERDKLIAERNDLAASLSEAVRYIQVATAYKGAMTAAEVEHAIAKNSNISRVEIAANSCNTLAAFDIRKAIDLLAKAAGVTS